MYISFVNHLPQRSLYQLLGLVEPNALLRSNPPSSQHGAFYAQPIGAGDPVEVPVENYVEEHVQVEPPSLPGNIWDMILQYDIGRLLLIMKTASQPTEPRIQSRTPTPRRFNINTLDLTGPIVQIQLISIGGRSYISHLSNPIDDNGTRDNTQLYFNLYGSKYLAAKNDEVGVIDIVFGQQEDGQPEWVLHNSLHPFNKEVSQIKGANFQGL